MTEKYGMPIVPSCALLPYMTSGELSLRAGGDDRKGKLHEKQQIHEEIQCLVTPVSRFSQKKFPVVKRYHVVCFLIFNKISGMHFSISVVFTF